MDNYNQSESYSPMYSHDHQEHHEHHDNPPNYSGGTSQPYMADPRPPKRNPAIVVTQIILGCCGCCCLLLLIGFLITSLTMNVTVDIDTSDYDDNSHDVYWDTALSISGSVGNFRSNISLVPEDIPSGVLSKMRICFQSRGADVTGIAQAIIPYSEWASATYYDIPDCTGLTAASSNGIPLCGYATVYVDVDSTSSGVDSDYTLDVFLSECNTNLEDCVCDYALDYLFLFLIVLVSVGMTIVCCCCACCCVVCCWGTCAVVTFVDESKRRKRSELVPVL